MGKAKWWVCDDCKSLNDLPANKCYNCRVAKPSAPTLMDDQYGEVSSGVQNRVGITVDRSQVGALTAPDPLEKAKGGDIIEAYGADDDQPLAMSQDPGSPPPALREPAARSISEVGGQHWSDSLSAASRPRIVPPAQTPPAAPDGPAGTSDH